MKRNRTIVLFVAGLSIMGALFCGCKTKRLYAEPADIRITNNGKSISELSKLYPSVNSAVFTGCDITDYDLSKLRDVRKITIDSCRGNFLNIQNLCPNLAELAIMNTDILKISSENMANMKNLKKLSISDSAVSLIEYIDSDEMETLSLFNTGIVNFDGIEKFKSLKYIWIRNSGRVYNESPETVYDITPFAKLNSLEELNITSNIKFDAGTIFNQPMYLYIGGDDQWIDVKNILAFEGLRRLIIHIYGGVDFPAELSRLKNLRRLAILASEIDDFPSDLRGFEALESLDFEMNRVLSFPAEIYFPSNFKQLTIQNENFDFSYYRTQYPDIEIHEGLM
jgi:Leucine-rich repeat (LRR) protein